MSNRGCASPCTFPGKRTSCELPGDTLVAGDSSNPTLTTVDSNHAAAPAANALATALRRRNGEDPPTRALRFVMLAPFGTSLDLVHIRPVRANFAPPARASNSICRPTPVYLSSVPLYPRVPIRRDATRMGLRHGHNLRGIRGQLPGDLRSEVRCLIQTVRRGVTCRPKQKMKTEVETLGGTFAVGSQRKSLTELMADRVQMPSELRIFQCTKICIQRRLP
jgi:hypothetical protein